MLTREIQLICVVGCQRSGTTLVGQILGAHRSALLIDETEDLYDWFAQISGTGTFQAEDLSEIVMAANQKYEPAHSRMCQSDGVEALSPAITYFVLKAPNLTYSYERLARLPVPVHVVYPVREPWAVVASMTKLEHIPMIENQIRHMQNHPDFSAEHRNELEFLADETEPVHLRRAMIWRVKSTLQRKFVEVGLTPVSFKYEDLIAEKQDIIQRLLDHCGLPHDPLVYSHDTVYRGFGPGWTERTRPIDRQSLERSRERLSAAEVEDIMRFGREEITLLGYDVPSLTSSPAKPAQIPEDILDRPILLSGPWGTGTRILSDMAERCGLFLGNRRNIVAESVEWANLVSELAIRKQNDTLRNGVVPWRRLLVGRARDVLSAGNWQRLQPWGWNLPQTMMLLPEVMQAFSHARIVHLVQHPVTFCLKAADHKDWTVPGVRRAFLTAAYDYVGRRRGRIASDPTHIQNAILWLYQIGQVKSTGHMLSDQGRYLELAYEDIRVDPRAALSRLSHFLGTDHAPQTDAVMQFDDAPMAAADNPKTVEIWDICGDLAATLGYDRNDPQSSAQCPL